MACSDPRLHNGYISSGQRDVLAALWQPRDGECGVLAATAIANRLHSSQEAVLQWTHNLWVSRNDRSLQQLLVWKYGIWQQLPASGRGSFFRDLAQRGEA